MHGTGTQSLISAMSAGNYGMAISLEAAQKRDPEFKTKAREAILAHLKAVGQASGEELVDVARAHGAVPTDDRAFGGVFQSLSRDGSIQCVGFTLRKKGHGTAGGRIWAKAA